MKLCTTCETQKPFDQFYKSRGYYTVPCKACAVRKAAAWAAANPDAALAAQRRSKATRDRSAEYAKQRADAKVVREQFPEAVRAKERAWYAANRERLAAEKLARRRANPERFRAAQRKHFQTEHGRAAMLAHKHARRALQLNATPAWADREAMADWFHLAAVMSRGGVKFSVDHIVPLKGRGVCGLHAESNFQLMPLLDNIAKGNRVWPDMWEKN